MFCLLFCKITLHMYIVNFKSSQYITFKAFVLKSIPMLIMLEIFENKDLKNYLQWFVFFGRCCDTVHIHTWSIY